MRKRRIMEIELKRDLNRLLARVLEEVEDKKVKGLDSTLEIAQKVYESKVSTLNLNVICPNLKVIRKKRMTRWSIASLVYFVFLLFPIIFDRQFNKELVKSQWMGIYASLLLYIPIYCYSFFRPSLMQLKRLLSISNKDLLNQLKNKSI